MKKMPGYLADFSTETVVLVHRSDSPPAFKILSPILDCLINEMAQRFFSSSESIFIGISLRENYFFPRRICLKWQN